MSRIGKWKSKQFGWNDVLKKKKKKKRKKPKFKISSIQSKINFANKMRKNMTKAEKALWDLLKDNKTGYEFKSQIIILGWIVDFICQKQKLVVEVDGKSHLTEASKKYDTNRANVMYEKRGLRTIRFTNDEILANPQEVVKKILENIKC